MPTNIHLPTITNESCSLDDESCSPLDVANGVAHKHVSTRGCCQKVEMLPLILSVVFVSLAKKENSLTSR